MSSNSRIPLILPVEIQVRELDAKVLLACIAAQRGFPVVIGRLKSILASIGSFPRSIYVSKGMGPGSVETFALLRRLGHAIAGWDEEALVHFPPETHFGKRVSPIAGRYLANIFAWGPESAELLRSNPQFRNSQIHVAGNPRLDLLRREVRPYFEDEVRTLRASYGEFILVNTNFPLVNSNREIFREGSSANGPRPLGVGGRGMTQEFAEKLWRHKHDNFVRFQDMIPRLARAFPEVGIVIRPHPSEKPEVYQQLAAEHERVIVENEGNVIPWQMASRAMIHNGCTTGVEANLSEVPTLSYGPTQEESFDLGRAFALPNLLSHRCPDFDSLQATLEKVLHGKLGCAAGDEHARLLEEFFAPLDGPLACDRIVDVLEVVASELADASGPSFASQLAAWRRRSAPRLAKALSKWTPGRSRAASKGPRGARRAVYPEVPLAQMQERVRRFERILGRGEALRIEAIERHVYRISR